MDDTIAGNHLMLTSEHVVKAIEHKARKVIGMLKRGAKFTPTQPDVMAILEKLQIEKRKGQTMTGNQNIYDYLEVLSSKAPVPGGGGASALGGALAAALGQMVANLTVGKKRYADVEAEMQQHLFALGILQMELVALADKDAEVFAPLAAAYGMPTETEDQKLQKDQVMEANLLAASLVPIQMMEKAVAVIGILEEMEQKGSRMAVSDVGVAVQFARTGLTGAVMNVYINTKSMKDRVKAEELNQQADRLLQEGIRKADTIYEAVRSQLKGGSTT